jgi:hypothetical protein
VHQQATRAIAPIRSDRVSLLMSAAMFPCEGAGFTLVDIDFR